MTRAAAKSVAAGEADLRWSNRPRLGMLPFNAQDQRWAGALCVRHKSHFLSAVS